jgi:hypothetical protein
VSGSAARLLRERADSYQRDAEALRGSDADAVAILTTLRNELRAVADQVEDGEHCSCQWCVGETTSGGLCGCEFCQHRRANKIMEAECCGMPLDENGRCIHRPGHDTGRLHGPGCVDCDNGVREFHRSRTDKQNGLRK